MPKTIDVQQSQLKFPAVCVVCMSPAATAYTVEKIFTFGKTNYTVQVPVPMCVMHEELASTKSSLERLIGWFGMAGGLVAGIVSAAALMFYWAQTEQGNLFLNLFSADFLGLGLFLIVWIATMFWLAPLFAESDAKQARNAVQLTHCWPKDQVIRLAFENEQLAEMVERETARSAA